MRSNGGSEVTLYRPKKYGNIRNVQPWNENMAECKASLVVLMSTLSGYIASLDFREVWYKDIAHGFERCSFGLSNVKLSLLEGKSEG